MKFGVITLQNAPWPELVERWRALDELGVDTIWVADELGNAKNLAQPWFEGWACVAALAYETAGARIGPLVSPITFRNPAVLAKAAVTVDHISGGRLELGVGAGGSEFDHELARIPQWQADERLVRLRAFVERLVELLADERLSPRPVHQRIPLTIAGHARETLRLAAEHADRWNAFGGRGLSAEEGLRRCAKLNDRLTALCEAIGRDPVTLRRSALIGYPFVAETPWRSEQAFHDFVERWAEAGFDELILYYPPDWAMPEGSVEPGLFERVVRDLIPGLR
jgi:alkanesulfonate monooxygenase SsuD/methylene tetrahydromethanopterin reductase-like flavin-dependent oxidoreductase (luciferase family)